MGIEPTISPRSSRYLTGSAFHPWNLCPSITFAYYKLIVTSAFLDFNGCHNISHTFYGWPTSNVLRLSLPRLLWLEYAPLSSLRFIVHGWIGWYWQRADTGTRTPNMTITNRLLYHLSYTGRFASIVRPRWDGLPFRKVIFFALCSLACPISVRERHPWLRQTSTQCYSTKVSSLTLNSVKSRISANAPNRTRTCTP